MMPSLVAYGSSGEESSDEESAGEEVSKPSVSHGGTLGLPPPKVVKSEPFEVGFKNMFASLPAPKRENSSVNFIEEEDNIPIKPKLDTKQKVKITIPSLADFKDDIDLEPRKKKTKLTPKGSGLLAILPEPKNSMLKSSRAMVPHVLTRKAVPKPVPRKQPAKPNNDSEDSGDESVDFKAASSSSVDFFSLTSHVAPEPAVINLEDLLPPTAGPSRAPPSHQPALAQHVELDVTETQQVPHSELQLDEEALRQLCGRRGARGEDVNVIELHADNMMPDPKEWMLKQMTEEQEQQHRSSQPSSAHKRKHQITYLAFQAKEREIELKNQWAQNRMTKKQTQAKYGF